VICTQKSQPTGIRCEPVSTNEGSLWGGRFADGPLRCVGGAEQVPPTSTGCWRPTTSPRPGRTLKCCSKPSCSTKSRRDGLLAGLDSLAEDVADGSFGPLITDEDVHARVWNGD